MPTRKIPIASLRQGMFIHELDISWMKSPFLRHRRKINTENDIVLLKKAGVKKLIIDLARGNDIQNENQSQENIVDDNPEEVLTKAQSDTQQEIKTQPEKLQKTEKSALTDELKVAKVLQGKISKLVDQLGTLVKEGRPVSVHNITPVINEALESICRNDQALLTMLHIQRQDLKLSDHAFGVFAVVLPLALKLSCSEQEINELGMAALLHDTGWSRLPMHLFGRKKTYTSAEMQLIEQHPLIVENVLNKSEGIPERVKILVKQHHEQCDGSGFPANLKKEAIDKLTQILQVADIYDESIHGLTDQPGMLPANVLKKIYQSARNGCYSETVVSEMILVMGVFPLTSAVELDNGEKALVIEIDKQNPLLPRIKIVYGTDGQPCKTEIFVDLAKQKEGKNLKIIKVIDPIDNNDDPLGLLRVDSV